MVRHPKFVLFALSGAAIEPSVEPDRVQKAGFLSRVKSALRLFGRRFDVQQMLPTQAQKTQPLQEASETAMRAAGPELLAGILSLKAQGDDPAAYRELLAAAGEKMRLSSQKPAPAAPSQGARSKARGLAPRSRNN